ncbi:cell division protein FtsL [Oceanospirillum maris]|uniref:cell division protein FtsL n=1 Tax=Oceanospirillum maris TaxID=64977 RepID=UPI000412AFEE|nr:cell division protein FtsL [Oceanospirillum maris]
MSSNQVASRNEAKTKNAKHTALQRLPVLQRIRVELLALLPESLSYSARLFIGFSLLTLISSLLVIYAAYENRLAYASLQNLDRQQRLYDVEWGQLLLERSTLASPSRIEAIARNSLQMQLISSDKVQIVIPESLESSPSSLAPAKAD